jgi:VanZ family protein
MQPERSKKIYWSAVALFWSVALLYFTLVPSPPKISGLFGWDKLQHAVSLGTLAYFVSHLCLEFRVARLRSCVGGFVAATMFGGLIEILQGCFTATRTAEILDFVADAFGAFMAVLIVFMFSVYREGRDRHI